jgi:hypothetical protein
MTGLIPVPYDGALRAASRTKARRLLLAVSLGLLTFAADAILTTGHEARAYVYRPQGILMPSAPQMGIRPGPSIYYNPAHYAPGHRYILGYPRGAGAGMALGWSVSPPGPTLQHDPSCPACAQRRSFERHIPR